MWKYCAGWEVSSGESALIIPYSLLPPTAAELERMLSSTGRSGPF